MSDLNLTPKVPLTRGEAGVFHVTGSRVTLDSIVHFFKGGATAEQIQEDFPSLSLGQVYSVIGYYLEHRGEVDEYLGEQARAAGALRNEVERALPTSELRERLRQRRNQTVA